MQNVISNTKFSVPTYHNFLFYSQTHTQLLTKRTKHTKQDFLDSLYYVLYIYVYIYKRCNKSWFNSMNHKLIHKSIRSNRLLSKNVEGGEGTYPLLPQIYF